MAESLLTILIPLRLTEPSPLEIISLDQTIKVLHKYPITFMAPMTLDTTWYENYCRGKIEAHVERFDWQGSQAFAELQLDAHFYERFLVYKYMLVCHLDAFVFRDEVEKWCSMDYDYIGSVVYNPRWVLKNDLKRKLTGFSPPEYFGNGGFALKKISSFYHITSKYRWYLQFNFWLRKKRGQGLLDDIFLTQHFPKLTTFKMPPRALAEKFGADYEVWDADKLPFNNQDDSTLPFGIHAWIQLNLDYWKPSIRRAGHDI
jgi:hypothetical protein